MPSVSGCPRARRVDWATSLLFRIRFEPERHLPAVALSFEQTYYPAVLVSDDLDRLRERLEMRLKTATMQHRSMPPASPNRRKAEGLVEGLQEALDMVRKQ
jgi:hypothetical protein